MSDDSLQGKSSFNQFITNKLPNSVWVMALAAAALGEAIPAVGTTTFRQPYTPVSFGSFAGPARGDCQGWPQSGESDEQRPQNPGLRRRQ